MKKRPIFIAKGGSCDFLPQDEGRSQVAGEQFSDFLSEGGTRDQKALIAEIPSVPPGSGCPVLFWSVLGQQPEVGA